MSATEPAAVPTPRWSPRRLLSVVIKLATAAGLLGYVFWRVDLRAVSRVMATADPSMLALAVVLSCLSFPLGGIRWWCVVRALGETAAPRLLIGLFWLAGLVGQVLPNPMGDAVRISVAARLGLGLGVAFRSAFLERVAMLAGLAIFFAATQPLLRARVGAADPVWLAMTLLALGAAGLAMLASADLLLRRLRRFRVISAFANLSGAFRRLVTSRWALPVLVTMFLSYLNTVAVAIVLGTALALPLSAGDYLAVIPVAVLATVLPVSIGGWGVREGVMLALFSAMGVPAASALAFSLMLGLLGIVAALPGLLTLWHERRPPAGRG